MEVYYFTIFFLMFISFFETRATTVSSQKSLNKFYWVPLVFIILQIGLRWDMGTDWDAYYNVFQNSSVPEFTTMEVGYLQLNIFFKKIFDNYQIFILFHAIFTYLVIFKFFKHFTHYTIFALLWFYATNLGMVGSNRQLFAVAICAIGLLYYIKNKKWYYFLLFIFVAMSFHTSAIFMVCYLFLDKKFSNKFILSLLFGSIIIGTINITGIIMSNIGILGSIAENKVSIYSAEIAEYSYLAIIKRLVVILPLLIYKNQINENTNANYVINGYVLGICIYLIFGQSLNIIATRGAMYFNIMEPILITYYIYLVKGIVRKHLLIFALSCFSLILLRQSIVQYPEIFAPYKNRFFSMDLIKY